MLTRMVVVAMLTACLDLKPDSTASSVDAGGATLDAPSGVSRMVSVERLAEGRSRPGAFTSQGWRPFRTGIATLGEDVVWVESGKTPGLYAVSSTATSGGDPSVRELARLTQPTSFSASGGTLYLADRSQLKTFTTALGAPKVVASVSADIAFLTSDLSSAFFVEAGDAVIHQTMGAATAPFLTSNGGPVGLALAGNRLFWASVDISGLNGAVQSMGLDKKGFTEHKRFNSGLSAIVGSDRYVYYAHTSPPVIHRLALTSGVDERVVEADSAVTEFALTDTHAYWTERGTAPDYANGRVMRIAHDAAEPEVLATSILQPVAIAAVGNTAYVASAGQQSMSYANGAILKVVVSP